MKMSPDRYSKFVIGSQKFDQTQPEAKDISIYGLVGEIGSIVTLIKKLMLANPASHEWREPQELVEELGDAFWYVFSSISLEKKQPSEILRTNVKNIRDQLISSEKKGKEFAKKIGEERTREFLSRSSTLLRGKELGFDDYQRTSFLTRRSHGKDLLEVCMAVLQGHAAQLMREKLPGIEKKLNRDVSDRRPYDVIGDVVWHLVAIASIFDIRLQSVIDSNVRKIRDRNPQRRQPTKLHDEDARLKVKEKFPRQMEIAFLKISPRHAQMYYQGKPLGDTLTDNAYDDDDYRFHDVLHLANAAYLGWSPVLRALLGRKRRSVNILDNVEDGARAVLVEEAIVKYVHSEGDRLTTGQRNERLFPSKESISFSVLKAARFFAKGLEVERNKLWEWENAIFYGYMTFYKLREEEQGTVKIDLNSRSMVFSPNVFMNIEGPCPRLEIVAIPSEPVSLRNKVGTDEFIEEQLHNRTLAAKQAILKLLDVDLNSDENYRDVRISYGSNQNDVSVKLSKSLREKMWSKGMISLQISFSKNPSVCRCMGIGDGLKQR